MSGVSRLTRLFVQLYGSCTGDILRASLLVNWMPRFVKLVEFNAVFKIDFIVILIIIIIIINNIIIIITIIIISSVIVHEPGESSY